ncbi:hypothetical protein DL96DRAFT_1702092 [Flagelloscypha sp. PMI_526]|nr:hypothetical protein DL96DRAFT_1702092 [Flagelloscypha sp. PMI_526]
MGCFDIFCMLSGVSSSGGPGGFFEVENEYSERDKRKVASRLATKLSDAGNPELPPEQELVAILEQALTDLGDWDTGIYIDHDCRWCQEVVVVGTVRDHTSHQDVTGVRICRWGDSYGGFDEMLGGDGEWISELTQVYENRAVFMDRRARYYLQSWLVVPHAAVDAQSGTSREFWEVFFDKVKPRLPLRPTADHWYTSTHPDLDMGLMSTTWGQFQDHTINKSSVELVTVPTLEQAISQGLRGDGLRSALLEDFHMWMFEGPDSWPTRAESVGPPLFNKFVSEHSSSRGILPLPLEVVLEILVYTSLSDTLNFTSTCKYLRRLTYDETFAMILRRMISDGSLCWLRPCSLVSGELENAQPILASWVHDLGDGEDPFRTSDFPFPAFVYTCFVKSASMKSRRRIYDVVKQLEAQWGEQPKQV